MGRFSLPSEGWINKRLDTLIDAYAIARRQSSLPPLLILGKGPERKALAKQISQLGIASSVFLVGEVTNVGDYYHSALALLHPARFEGMPNVVLEAMGTGTPVVVSNSQGGILDLVSDDVSAMIFNTDDVNQLAEVIRQLNEDPALRERLGLCKNCNCRQAPGRRRIGLVGYYGFGNQH